jgi:hypothetical protein
MGIIVAAQAVAAAMERFGLKKRRPEDSYNNLQTGILLLNAVKCMTSVMLRRNAHFDAVSHTKNRWNELRGIHRIVEKLEVIDARSIPWVAVWRPCRCRPFNGDDVL